MITSETAERPDTKPEHQGVTSEPDAVTAMGATVQDRPAQAQAEQVVPSRSPAVAGLAVEVTDEDVLANFADGAPPGPFHLFRLDLAEAVVVRLGEPADHLVIESWHEGRGLQRIERR